MAPLAAAALVATLAPLMIATTGGLAAAEAGTTDTSAGEGPGERQENEVEEFPSPLVVPVLTEGSVPPHLAVTSFFISPDAVDEETFSEVASATGNELVVRFAEPFRLPDEGRYRVAAHIGDPTTDHIRVSLVVVAGVSTGVVEIGSGDDWEREGRAEVVFDADEVSLTLPPDLDPAQDMIWIEASRGDGGDASAVVSPLVMLAELLGAGPAASTLTASDLAWGSVSQPPRPPVEVQDPPTVTVADGEILVTYPGPPPATVDGREVETILDVVRLAPDFEGGGAAPWLVAIDHQRGEVALLDGTMPIPAAIPNDGAWILEGYPEGGIEAGTELVFDLEAVLDEFGFADQAATAALGIARSLTLADGTRVRPDGVLATLEWFEGGAPSPGGTIVPTTESAAGPSAREASTDSGSDSFPVAAVAAGCVAALLMVAGWLAWRWWRYRVEAPYQVPESPHEARPVPPKDEGLDELTEQLFGP